MAMLLCAASARAQDIYQMERMSSEDLSGTARFVGMGGAMGALGADISAMRTNPAAGGLFRHADAAVTIGVSSLSEGESFDDVDKGRLSFDQIGFVYPFKMGKHSSLRSVNFGFNYQKRNNLHSLVNADQALGGESQTWQMADLASFWGGPEKGSPLTDAGYETFLYNQTGTQDGEGYDEYEVYDATRGAYDKAMTGGVQAYDFNLSMNFADRFFFGIGAGVYNVDISSYSEYRETLTAGEYTLVNDREITGTGVDFKFGTVIYPFDGYTFRFGLSASTPVFYSLTEKTGSAVFSQIADERYDDRYDIVHDYNIRTPWKFNVSAGGTVGGILALGAEYEYADCSAAKVSYDDDYYDDWYDWGRSTTKDKELNRQAGRHLKGVHTVRLGAEASVEAFSVRVGYNYITSPMKDKAFLNQFINSASLDYSTSTDYMNLSDINRLTCGFGYSGKHFYADFAYMFQKQDGDFYAFSTQRGDESAVNDARPSKIKLDKSKFLLTVGYSF